MTVVKCGSLYFILTFHCMFVWARSCSARTQRKAYFFLVDDAKLDAVKAAAKALPDEPDRISANDVLMSACGRVCKSNLLIMAAEFKGQIEGTSATDSAQYHAALLLDVRTGHHSRSAHGATAALPRIFALPSQDRLLRIHTRLPAGADNELGRAQEPEYPGMHFSLHTPCEQISGMVVKVQDDTCIVFNPCPGKIAMLIITNKLSASQLKVALPFEGPLAPKMWAHV